MNVKNSIGEKIRKAIKEAGLTQQNLADKLGITNPVVNVWIQGRRTPNIENLKKIAAATGKSYSYFIEEEGEEFAQSVRAVPLTPNNTVTLPILADVPAGLPEYSDRDVEMFVDIPRWLFPGGDFVVKCIGDSLEPEIRKGDYCVIRKMTDPLDCKPMLVKTEHGICMKVVRKGKDGRIWLCSLNPKYKPFVSEILTIIGLILGRWNRTDRDSFRIEIPEQ